MNFLVSIFASLKVLFFWHKGGFSRDFLLDFCCFASFFIIHIEEPSYSQEELKLKYLTQLFLKSLYLLKRTKKSGS